MGKFSKLLTAAWVSCLLTQSSLHAGFGAWLNNFLQKDITTQQLENKSHKSIKARHKYLNHLVDNLLLHASLGNNKKIGLYDELIHQSNASALKRQKHADDQATIINEMILIYSNLENELAGEGNIALAKIYAELTQKLHVAQIALATTQMLCDSFAQLREFLALSSAASEAWQAALQEQENAHRVYDAVLAQVAHDLIAQPQRGLGDIGYTLLCGEAMQHGRYARILRQCLSANRAGVDPLSVFQELATQYGIMQTLPKICSRNKRLQQAATLKHCLNVLQKSLSVTEFTTDIAAALAMQTTQEMARNEGIPVFEKKQRNRAAAAIASDAEQIRLLEGSADAFESEDDE